MSCFVFSSKVLIDSRYFLRCSLSQTERVLRARQGPRGPPEPIQAPLDPIAAPVEFLNADDKLPVILGVFEATVSQTLPHRPCRLVRSQNPWWCHKSLQTINSRGDDHGDVDSW